MITPEMIAAIRAEIDAYNKSTLPALTAGMPRFNPFNIPFQNDSGETIPPYAVMRPDALANRNGNFCIKMKKPDTKFRRRYYINGPFAVPEDGFGMCSDGSYPTLVRSETTGTFIDFQSNFGIENGSWDLKRGGVGRFMWMDAFNAISGPYAASVRPFQQIECTLLIVQSTSAVTPGTGFATYNIVDEDGETSITISASCNIYPSGIGGETPQISSEWPNDTIFGAGYYGGSSASQGGWHLQWGYSQGTPIP